MRKSLIAAAAALLSLTLAGCSTFYPNWGATGLPAEPETQETATSEPLESEASTVEASSSQSEQSESEPTEAPSEQASEVSEIQRSQVSVEIIMAIPEPEVGVLTVVAQVPGISESGGMCTLRFIGADQEKTMEVRAEPSSDYTQCFPIEVPLADLPTGNGIVTVTYDSERHFGTSPASSVVIP